MKPKILSEKIEDLHKIAKALLTYETLTGEEIEDIVTNKYPENKQDLAKDDENKIQFLDHWIKTKNSSLIE